MARLIARQDLTDGNFHFYAGDAIPSDYPQAIAWVESGAAAWEEDSDAMKAVLLTAVPGLPGAAVGAEGAPENLIGKAPATEQRKRRRKNDLPDV